MTTTAAVAPAITFGLPSVSNLSVQVGSTLTFTMTVTDTFVGSTITSVLGYLDGSTVALGQTSDWVTVTSVPVANSTSKTITIVIHPTAAVTVATTHSLNLVALATSCNTPSVSKVITFTVSPTYTIPVIAPTCSNVVCTQGQGYTLTDSITYATGYTPTSILVYYGTSTNAILPTGLTISAPITASPIIVTVKY